jgi:putative endonuclease
VSDPRHELGRDAERAVATWLTRCGWLVLGRRQRPLGGAEIDIIALDPAGVLVAIEVRARRTRRAGSPAASIDRRHVARLRRSLAAHAAVCGHRHTGLRVDIVTAEPDRPRVERWRLVRIPSVG